MKQAEQEAIIKKVTDIALSGSAGSAVLTLRTHLHWPHSSKSADLNLKLNQIQQKARNEMAAAITNYLTAISATTIKH